MRRGEGERLPPRFRAGVEGERLPREGDLRLRGGGLPEGERLREERSEAEFSFSITGGLGGAFFVSTKNKRLFHHIILKIFTLN